MIKSLCWESTKCQAHYCSFWSPSWSSPSLPVWLHLDPLSLLLTVLITLVFQFGEHVRFILASGCSHMLFLLLRMPPFCLHLNFLTSFRSQFKYQFFRRPLLTSLCSMSYVLLHLHIAPWYFSSHCYHNLWWVYSLSRDIFNGILSPEQGFKSFWINAHSQVRQWKLK